MKTITILLADDHTVVREGTRRILEVEPDITVVGEASTGIQAMEMAASLRPDVVVMDIAMPLLKQTSGSGLTRYAISAGIIESSVQKTTD